MGPAGRGHLRVPSLLKLTVEGEVGVAMDLPLVLDGNLAARGGLWLGFVVLECRLRLEGRAMHSTPIRMHLLQHRSWRSRMHRSFWE